MRGKEGIPMKSVVVSIVAALALSAVACGNDNSAERAGEKIDEAIEDTGEAIEDAGEAIDETAEEAAEKARKAVE
jgi:hypothetical protein